MPELTDTQAIIRFFLPPSAKASLDEKKALMEEVKALSETDRTWFASECRKYV